MVNDEDAIKERKLMRERQLRRERNALTVMPLPIKIPVEWYELLPRVLPLIGKGSNGSRFYMPEETIEAFQKMWKQRLMRRDGNDVWVHLGGLECYETIPNFTRGVEYRIKGRDAEIKRADGLKALIKHWRDNVKGFDNLDDKAVLEARIQLIHSLEPLMSTLALSSAWGDAYERSRQNILKIRPVIQRWMEQHGNQWNLDEPFGGKLT